MFSDDILNTPTHGGVLLYDVSIDEKGDVAKIEPLRPIDSKSPWPEMDELWRAAIADWRYEPTVVAGRPVCVRMAVSVIIDVR